MQIDKDLKIPASVGKRTAGIYKYPWRDMARGDSVFFKDQTTQGRAASSAKDYAKRYGKSFSARTVKGGVRIWRTL